MQSESCFGALQRRSSAVVVSAALVALLAACGDSTEKRETRTTVVSAKPKASVTGLVTDGSRKPLEGAQVTLHIGKETRETSTDGAGRWSFTGVPAGSFIGVEITAEGHATAWRQAELPSSAGEYPQSGASVEVGPTALYALDGSIQARVIAPDGREILATGAQCRVDASWADWSLGVERPLGEFAVEAVLKPGELHCNGLPGLLDLLRSDSTVTIVVPPLDVDGDGIVDLAGEWIELELDELAAGLGGAVVPEITVVLEGREGLPKLLATNVPAVEDRHQIRRSIVDPDEGLTFIFDRPVVVHRVRILDEDGEQEIAYNLDVDSYKVGVRPGDDGWTPGQEFNIQLTVAGKDAPDRPRTFAGPFLVTSEDELTVVSATFVDWNDNGLLDDGERIRIELSQVIGWAMHDLDPPELRLFFDEDLDSSGDVGDGWGEWGYHSGLVLETDEPVRTGIVASNFTRYLSVEWEDASIIEDGSTIWIEGYGTGDPPRLPDGRLVLEPMKAVLKAVSE